MPSNTPAEWLPVISGVRQGCVFSPTLFLVIIDWLMRKATSDKYRGIEVTLFSQIEDLDFANDLALLSVKIDLLQKLTNKLDNFAPSKLGLPSV